MLVSVILIVFLVVAADEKFLSSCVKMHEFFPLTVKVAKIMLMTMLACYNQTITLV